MNNDSRRKFVQRAAALAVASFTGPCASTEETQKKVGWALCGLGLWSTVVANSISRAKHSRLVALITDASEKARTWQAKYNIPPGSIYTYDSMYRMASNPDIDVVYVLTPHTLHLPHALSAVSAGKHVFVEKPMETTVERCQKIIDACRKADRRLGVGYRFRFEPNNVECMRISREKEFGAVRVVEASFCTRLSDAGSWRLKRELAGGGALMDVGVYTIQAARYLTGEEPTHVSAIETKTDPVRFKEVDETVIWQARFPSGAVANCSASYNASGMSRFFVNADRGWFDLDNAFTLENIHGRRSDDRLINLENIDQLAAQMDDFSQCIVQGKPSLVSGEEGLRDIRIMMSIYESIRTGRRVSLVGI